jgi:hypothetical protein
MLRVDTFSLMTVVGPKNVGNCYVTKQSVDVAFVHRDGMVLSTTALLAHGS